MAGTSLAFSARIKLPAGGQGYWPAFWMLGKPGSWPSGGELDAMENFDNEPEVRGTLHCGPSAVGGPCHEPTGVTSTHALGKPAGSVGFHTYTIVLNTSPERATWYVDDTPYMTVDAATIGPDIWHSTFKHDFTVLLNVAIGGNVPGNPDAATHSGSPMLVDNVAVAVNGSADAGPPAL